ncbi:DUF4190 domain-containing protein [Leucobacter luti]|uniref:DUF4190 domain-containing protein n=1 Tax=Leucobacter luti TaxID=340320 RepID=UPI003D0207E1
MPNIEPPQPSQAPPQQPAAPQIQQPAPQQPAPQQPTPAQFQPSQPGPPAPPAPPVPPQPVQPGYAPQGAPSSQPPLNALALVSFIGSFFVSLVGIICGHIALSQIKKSGERGRGFALAGTIIGYVSAALTILAVISMFVIGGIFTTAAVSTLGESDSSTTEMAPGTTTPFDDPADEGPSMDSSDGEYSAEFCAALETFMTETESMTGTEAPKGLIDAADKLAGIPSPNQSLYKDYANFLRDPMSADPSVIEESMTIMPQDYLACM